MWLFNNFVDKPHFLHYNYIKGGEQNIIMKDRLKQLRKILNLTQQELADKLNISRNNIASYETGKSNIGASVISLICKEFNVNEEWLRNGTGEMFIEISEDDEYSQAAASIAKNNDVEIMSLLIEYWKLDNDSKEIFKNYLRNVSERINTTKTNKQGNFKPITVEEMEEIYNSVPDDPAELEKFATTNKDAI